MAGLEEATERVLGEIRDERDSQRSTHGWDPAHDDVHEMPSWSYLLASRSVTLGHPWPDAAGVDQRRLLIEIAAIAVAAVEAFDRRALQSRTAD